MRRPIAGTKDKAHTHATKKGFRGVEVCVCGLTAADIEAEKTGSISRPPARRKTTTRRKAEERAQRGAAVGQARAEAHAPEHWKLKAREELKALCVRLPFFTVDDLWTALGIDRGVSDTEVNPSAIGAILKYGNRQAWCQPTGEFRKSERATHHHDSRVWKSVIFGG